MDLVIFGALLVILVTFTTTEMVVSNIGTFAPSTRIREILENNLICSNPTNCEGRSTIQGGQCEIDCAPVNLDPNSLDPCYSNGDPNSDLTICAQGFKCLNPTNCNGLNIVEGGHCETICEDDRDPCLPDGVQDRPPSTILYF